MPIDVASVTVLEHTREVHSFGSWQHIKMIDTARKEFFNEAAYVDFNPDVRNLIALGQYKNGLDHFCHIGHTQDRKMIFNDVSIIREAKLNKLSKIEHLLLPDLQVNERTLAIDTVGVSFAEDVPISAWSYNSDLFALLEKHQGGVIVDLGAGFRPQYYFDIINVELGNFATTDIRSMAEKLPFKDNTVDVLFSIAVFEHVARPWDVAREIERVLKPGGIVRVDAAFMAPRHGYPSHYYNMTMEGLSNLFQQIEILESGASIFGHAAYSMYWVARAYREGLPEERRAEFDNMRIGEMLSYSDPIFLLQDRPFLKEISKNRNDDIAFNVAITGIKRGDK
jgi:SAM-dependent methyltransferase